VCIILHFSKCKQFNHQTKSIIHHIYKCTFKLVLSTTLCCMLCCKQLRFVSIEFPDLPLGYDSKSNKVCAFMGLPNKFSNLTYENVSTCYYKYCIWIIKFYAFFFRGAWGYASKVRFSYFQISIYTQRFLGRRISC
jgi:hypothetical protein